MDFDLIMNLFALGCGGYCAYTWVRLVTGKQLFPNALLIPNNKKPADCSDEAAYIRRILPSLGVLAVVTLIYGVVFTVNDMLETPLLGYPWNLLPVVLVLAALVWYAVVNAKANRMYFGK